VTHALTIAAAAVVGFVVGVATGGGIVIWAGNQFNLHF
jgi:hypothetical protein